MRGVVAAAACAALCAGCGSSNLPPPRIVSIDPNRMVASETTWVTIAVDAVLPFKVDYNTSTVTVQDDIILSIGDKLELDAHKFVAGGLLPAFVPSKLDDGVHDVTITIVGDQRVGTLPAAFTVTPGTWPAKYRVDLLPPAPVSGMAFQFAITALNQDDSIFTGFRGTVDYVISRGVTPVPVTTKAFENGARTETATITGTGGYFITVTDLKGTSAMSSPINL